LLRVLAALTASSGRDEAHPHGHLADGLHYTRSRGKARNGSGRASGAFSNYTSEVAPEYPKLGAPDCGSHVLYRVNHDEEDAVSRGLLDLGTGMGSCFWSGGRNLHFRTQYPALGTRRQHGLSETGPNSRCTTGAFKRPYVVDQSDRRRNLRDT